MSETVYKCTYATKQKLLSAVVKLSREKGYAKVAVRDICRESGVSNGAFYHHFPSKDALALESYSFIDNIIDKKLLSVCNEMPPFEALEYLVRLNAEYTEQTSGLLTCEYFRLILQKESKSVFSTDRAFYKAILIQLNRCKENQLIKSDLSAEALTEYIMQFVRGMSFDWCIKQATYSLPDRSATLFPLFAKGFMCE